VAVPERTAHTEAMRAGTPVAVGSITLLPIERVVVHTDRGGSVAWLAAVMEPRALIVRDGRGIRAIDAGAAEIPLDALRAEVPALDAALAAM
jgi:hypothetical protein